MRRSPPPVASAAAAHEARAPAPVTHLLYLHGFRSSPQSFKARRMAEWLTQERPDVRWACPQLAPAPAEALAQTEAILRDWGVADAQGRGIDRVAVIGSSLGGFYATVLAQRHRLPAVLLNPAVNPARDLAAHLGEQTGYHDPALRFTFTQADVEALAAMTPDAITRPERYAAVIATGDEVLDWREMAARYAGAHLHIIEGSDHALADFDDHLPFVLRFLHLI